MEQNKKNSKNIARSVIFVMLMIFALELYWCYIS